MFVCRLPDAYYWCYLVNTSVKAEAILTSTNTRKKIRKNRIIRNENGNWTFLLWLLWSILDLHVTWMEMWSTENWKWRKKGNKFPVAAKNDAENINVNSLNHILSVAQKQTNNNHNNIFFIHMPAFLRVCARFVQNGKKPLKSVLH